MKWHPISEKPKPGVLALIYERYRPDWFYVDIAEWEYKDEQWLCRDDHKVLTFDEPEKAWWIDVNDIDFPDKCERDKDGYIKKICMRPKCNQPIWVREYQKFTNEHPLLCATCWFEVKTNQEIFVQLEKYKDLMSAKREAIEIIMKDKD